MSIRSSPSPLPASRIDDKPETRASDCNEFGFDPEGAELIGEAERIRDRPAEMRNDLGALDRTVTVLSHGGKLDEAMPRRKRQLPFGHGGGDVKSAARAA